MKLITSEVLVIVPILFFSIVMKSSKMKKWSFRYLLKTTLLMVFFTCMFALTIFPIPVNPEYIQNELAKGPNNHPFNNFELFQSIKRFYYYSPSGTYFFKQIFGNILLFMPLGFILPSVFPKQNHLVKVFFISFLTSVMIEFIQYSISNSVGFVIRVADVDDVVLNTIGGIIGFMMYQIWTKIVPIRR